MEHPTHYDRLVSEISARLLQIRRSPDTITLLCEIKAFLDSLFGGEHNQIHNMDTDVIASRILSQRNQDQVAFNLADYQEARTRASLEANLYYEAIVHFPEVVMTNSKGHSHTIYDLYVKFAFDSQGRFRLLSGSPILGLRTTGTIHEIDHEYVHSHLYRMEWDDMRFQPFCVGEGPIKSCFADLRESYSKYGFQLFCHQLREMVKWESLEGLPYMLMADLSHPVVDNEQTEDSAAQEVPIEKLGIIWQLYRERVKGQGLGQVKEMIDITLLASSIKIAGTPHLERFLVSMMEENPAFFPVNCFAMKGADGTYYPYASTSTLEQIALVDRPILKFQNRDVRLKIINHENKENHIQKYPAPEITQFICKQISDKANRYWFTKGIIHPTSTSRSA